MMRSMRNLMSTTRPTNTEESGFLVSLMTWGLCFGIRTKILSAVCCTWAKIIWSFVWHGIAGTLPNGYACYSFAVLILLTGILIKTLFLEYDVSTRTIALARASVNLGMA